MADQGTWPAIERRRRPRAIIVLVDGGPADEPVIELACEAARKKGGELQLVRPVVVERALPLDAPLTEDSDHARVVLERAEAIALRFGCTAKTRELRTRDIAAALVDEAADTGCDQVFLGVGGEERMHAAAMAVAEQVLRQAPCPVWLCRLKPAR